MGGRPKTNPNVIKKAVKLYQTGQYSIKEIEELTSIKRSDQGSDGDGRDHAHDIVMICGAFIAPFIDSLHRILA